jgi:protein CpxP
MPSQGQAGSTTSSGQGQAAGRSSSVEDELQLTEDQKAKLQPIIQDEMIQIDAVRTDNSLSMEQKQAKVSQIKKDHFPKIEAILTPEQRKKLADMQERARQQRQGGSQSNPQQPPQ